MYYSISVYAKIIQRGKKMKNRKYSILLVALILFVFVSCASKTEMPLETVEPQTSNSINDNSQNVSEITEPSDDISLLNGTIWEYETQIGDFTAWRCISIEDGRAMYYMRMGNAIDTDPNTAAVYLKGDVITFTQDDGSTHTGQIIGDTILLDEQEMYIKLP